MTTFRRVLGLLCICALIGHVLSKNGHDKNKGGDDNVNDDTNTVDEDDGNGIHEGTTVEGPDGYNNLDSVQQESDNKDRDGNDNDDSDSDNEDHDGNERDKDTDHDQALREQCKELCSGNTGCPHVCPQAYLDPWVGR